MKMAPPIGLDFTLCWDLSSSQDDIKIFDFGLAKELNSYKQNCDGTFTLTGATGSPRYMAPEVALSRPYNLSADIYSFGTMLWEIMSLSKPYIGFNKYMFTEIVVHGGGRPSMSNSWPLPLRNLISRCWSKDMKERPSANECYLTLRGIITKMRKGDDTGLEHRRRRSTHVLQMPSVHDMEALEALYGASEEEEEEEEEVEVP